MKSATKIPRYITVTSAVACVVGILVSLYTYHVEMAHEADPSFRALCDISESISCTKVFSSRWGKGFGLMPKDSIMNQPNSVFGAAYYITQALLGFTTSYLGAMLSLAFSMLSIVGCIYLAYILFVVLQDVCVVCISMYVINIILFICCILKFRAVSSGPTAKTSRAKGKESKKMK